MIQDVTDELTMILQDQEYQILTLPTGGGGVKCSNYRNICHGGHWFAEYNCRFVRG